MKNEWDALQIGLPTTHGVATYPAGATFGPRRMRDWEFVWILEGETEYSRRESSDGSSGETRVAAPAGAIVLCRPHATDAFRWDEKKRTRHAFFHFRVTSLPSAWPPLDAWPLVRLPQHDDLMRPVFRHLMHALTSRHAAPADAAQELQTRLAIAQLMSCFVNGDEGNSGGNAGSGDELSGETWPDAVERAWDAIQRRLEEAPDAAISLSELAKTAHTTPEHLCRIFKAATGWTPIQAVRLARLDRAAVLLARSNYNVSEIARLCGFASAFHFSRRFKDAFGQAPRELRRDIQNGQTPPVSRLLRFRA